MTPGLVAFFVFLACLFAFYAIIAPTNRKITYKSVHDASKRTSPAYTGAGAYKDNFPDQAPWGSEQLEVEKEVGLFERWVRPAVRNFLPQTPAALTEYAQKNKGIRALLAKTDNPWRVTPEEYVGLRVLSVLAFTGVGVLVSTISFMGLPLYITMPAGAAIGFLIPKVMLGSKWSARRRDLTKTLPEALDLIRICMNSGQNFTNALKQSVELLPEGTTKKELSRMSAELAAGRSLNDALLSLSYRCPTDGVESFARAVIQATETGSDISDTLMYQSDEIRAEYERIIEVRAQKLQTTLFFPIILFLLPALMIIVFGPALSGLGGAL